jgi:hypothetical protein
MNSGLLPNVQTPSDTSVRLAAKLIPLQHTEFHLILVDSDGDSMGTDVLGFTEDKASAFRLARTSEEIMLDHGAICIVVERVSYRKGTVMNRQILKVFTNRANQDRLHKWALTSCEPMSSF